ncbi:MAG: signal peptidase I [Polyangiaceae bacterium]
MVGRPQPKNRRSSWRKDLISIASAAAVVLVGRSSLADHYHVPTGSMLPTVVENDHILVNKAAYGLRLPFTHVRIAELGGPERGDVVVLESPESGIVLLKRVVALPGDMVAVEDGHVVLNGHPVLVEHKATGLFEELGQGHGLRLDDGGGPDFGPVKVPAGHYLVLGDNRGNSRDGRYFGFVKREAILGRAVGILARHSKLTWIDL